MDDRDFPEVLSLTASLVAAYLRGNPLPTGELAGFIRTTHSALAAALAPPDQLAAAQLPAISIKKSVRPDAIVCLECGREKQMLKRHLTTAHNLTVDDYKTKWSLSADYPMTAPDYASTRSDLAKKIGLGRKPAKAANEEAPVDAPVAETPAGTKYPASRWSKPKS